MYFGPLDNSYFCSNKSISNFNLDEKKQYCLKKNTDLRTINLLKIKLKPLQLN